MTSLTRLFLTFLCFSLFLLPLLTSSHASALSEYGLLCEENKECVKCKEDVKCMSCMNKCWNFYGSAETTGYGGGKDSRIHCLKKQAKWCNAQCWDPDETKEPDYVSTKPFCPTAPFPKEKWFKGRRN